MKKVVISIVIVVAIALVVCFVPMKEVAYAITVDYEDTETYYENEPYEVTENYTEVVPLDYWFDSYVRQEEGTLTHITQVNMGTSAHSWEYEQRTRREYLTFACVKVKNMDTVAGTFWVSISVKEPSFEGDNPYPSTWEHDMFPEGKLDLAPGEVGVRQCLADELGDWTYNITADTKKIEQERTATKYRQVEKQRTVSKQRQETRFKNVSLLDYLLHYQ